MGTDDESGYASGSSSEASIPEVFFTKPHLTFLNRQLQNLEPQGQLRNTLKVGDTADLACRNSPVVHHVPTIAIPDDRIRSHRARHARHAF